VPLTDARHELLRGLIDDAGLFPPARKPMARAVADHAAARAEPSRWMLGRFLCPASRLEELAAAAPDRAGWRYGAILDGAGEDWLGVVRADLDRIAAFRARKAVEVVELRLPPGTAGRAAIAGFLPVLAELPGVEAFLEVPDRDPGEIEATVAAIGAARASARVGAKIRCGGLAAEAFPPAGAVATFIEAARRHDVPFKATAGLHHPFRTVDAEIGVLQHGFVNLLAATALPGVPAAEVIEDAEAGSFVLGAAGLCWRGQVADAAAVARARSLFTAFGSCSFEEPVEELVAAGILVAGAPA